MVIGIATRRIEVVAAGRTHPGLQRKENQDQFLVAQLARTLRVKGTSMGSALPDELIGQPQGTLLMVADGVGGVSGGEQASQLVVDTMSRRMLELAPLSVSRMRGDEEWWHEQLRSAVMDAREAIREAGRETPEHADMGSTLTLGYLLWPRLHLVHLGDSRCYLLREGRLGQLTRDHTVARRLVENGVLDPADEARSPYSSVLWNAISARQTKLEPQLLSHELEDGDVLLLCSDGLTRHLSDQEIAKTLSSLGNPAVACEALVRAANEAGGSDNTTVVVARLQERDDGTPTAARPRLRTTGVVRRPGADATG